MVPYFNGIMPEGYTVEPSSSFLFGDEARDYAGFFRTAAYRMAVALPIAVTFSSSVTIALTYLMAVLWLLGGHWKEHFATLRGSLVLLAAVPLVLWTFTGIFRIEEMSLLFSVRYWFGHYPYIFIIILATILARKEGRHAALSSMNIAVILCCIWAVGFFWYHSNRDPLEAMVLRIHSIYLFRNTICFSMGLALWAGMWICLPYSSRHIAWVRKVLPKRLLDGMERASGIDLWTLAKALVGIDPSGLRKNVPAVMLALLRWGIVVFSVFFMQYAAPSRTGLLAFFFGCSAVLLKWNIKKGFLVIVTVLLPFMAMLVSFSPISETKTRRTVNDIKQTWQVISDNNARAEFAQNNRDRLGIQLALLPYALEKALCGWGPEKAITVVLKETSFNDPHCEFLFMQLQHGAIGLGCFLFWMLMLFVVLGRLEGPWQKFALFLAVIVWIDCMFNNAFSYHRETYLLCISIALVAIMEIKNRDTDWTTADVPPANGEKLPHIDVA